MQAIMGIVFSVRSLIGVAGGGILTLIGGWDLALQVLVILVAIDYITGLLAAWYECCLNSNTGFWGITKKILLFVPVVIAYWIDVLLGQEILRNMAIFFYISNEGLSILENIARLGVDIPEPLRRTLELLKKPEGEVFYNNNNNV